MKVTGERFVPGKMFKHSEIEHMHRYIGIKEILKGKTVLDAACGTGYGSDIIASTAKKVYGVDISQEAVDFANEHFGSRENLKYLQGDVTKLPFEAGEMDVVVSFETIEHINATMQKEFLAEIKRVLKPDGILIMSTPNKEIYTIQAGNQATEWHVKEFFEEEYDEFLRSQFTHVKYFQQYISRASFLVDGNADNAFLANYDSKKKGKFILAVASNQEIDDKVNINSIYYYPDEYAALDELCQIFYGDEANGFDESQAEIVEISSRTGKIEFNLELEGQLIKRLRVDPMNNSCAIEDLQIEITVSSGDKIHPVCTANNADKVVDNIHFFYHRDPQYIFELEKGIEAEYLNVSFTVKDYNIDAYTFLNESIGSLQQTISSLEGTLASLQAERDSLQEEKISLQKERDSLEGEKAHLNNLLEEKEAEREAFLNLPLHQRVGRVLSKPDTNEAKR